MSDGKELATKIHSVKEGGQPFVEAERSQGAMLLKLSIEKNSIKPGYATREVSQAIIHSLDMMRSKFDTQDLTTKISAQASKFTSEYVNLMLKLSDRTQQISEEDVFELKAEELYSILEGVANFSKSETATKLSKPSEVFFDMFAEPIKRELSSSTSMDEVSINQREALLLLISR